ncbi:hypothetical protein D3C76_1375450 [compost metagenome]
MFGAGASKNIDVLYRFLEGSIVHGVQVHASQHLVGILQANLATDSSGGAAMIASDHFYDNARPLALLNCLYRLGSRWINQADHAQQR